MNFKAKKLLLIVELNQTLLYIKNDRSKVKDFRLDNLNLKFDFTVDKYSVLYRRGKSELLDYLFSVDKDKIDVGVWTSFDSHLTQLLCKRYFGRFFRDLLFVLPTNRALYAKNDTQPHDLLKIPRQLNGIYNNFPAYSSANTLLLTTYQNSLTEHIKNDVVIPSFTPKNPDFLTDVGCAAVNKYVRGIITGIQEQRYRDVREINYGKPLDHLFKRFGHRTFKQTEYR